MGAFKQIFRSLSLTTLTIALAMPASVFASSERVKISQQQLSVEITETLNEYKKHKTFGELQKFISARVSANAMKEVERRIGKNQSGRVPAAHQEGDTIVFVNTEVPVTLRIVDPDKHIVEVNHTQVTLSDDFMKDMRNLEAALPHTHSSFFNFHLMSEAQAQEPISTALLVGIAVGVFAIRALLEIYLHVHTQHNVGLVNQACSELKKTTQDGKHKPDAKTCEDIWDVYGKTSEAIAYCVSTPNRTRDAWLFGCRHTEDLQSCKDFLYKLCTETPPTVGGAPASTQPGR